MHRAPLLAASSSEFIDLNAICYEQTFRLYPHPIVYTLSMFLTIAIESIIRLITLPANPVSLTLYTPRFYHGVPSGLIKLQASPPVTSYQQVWEQESSTQQRTV